MHMDGKERAAVNLFKAMLKPDHLLHGLEPPQKSTATDRQLWNNGSFSMPKARTADNVTPSLCYQTAHTSSSLESTLQTAKMWKIFLLIGAVNALPAFKERYLTTVDETDFYKVRVSGYMTNTNVRAACKSVGMRLVCHEIGSGACDHYWSRRCVSIDAPDVNSCRTVGVLSQSMCGITEAYHCQPLDDIFVYYDYSPFGYHDDSAAGVDVETSQWDIVGENYADKYALCAVQQKFLMTLERWMFYQVLVKGEMDKHNIEDTCQYAGMSPSCWYTGHGSCDTTSYHGRHCISFDHADITCRTIGVLSYHLCGTTDAHDCQVLNGTFVYSPLVYDGAGTIYGDSNVAQGSSYSNMYALCAVAQCHDSPCVHGRCAEYEWVNVSVCWCDDGWTGVTCDTLIDSCKSDPCMSGGTCQSVVKGYTCTCPPQRAGRNCEIVVHGDKCYWFSEDSLSNPEASTACHNKGGFLLNVQQTPQHQLLVSDINQAHDVSFWIANVAGDSVPSWMYHDCVLLDSSASYMGTYHSCLEQHNYICESGALDCQQNMCQNGGRCTSCFGDSTVFCDCPQGFTGILCEIAIFTDPCDPNPCPLDWPCFTHNGGLHCTVPTRMKSARSGFCTESSCGPGWTCVEDGPAGYFCISG
ncbi:uncharacterized protein LOC144862924 [Branchiostoma floridae x Branchiostoma japonicum]